MIRRTITLPDELAAAVDRCVEEGVAPNVSRFVQEAVRDRLAALERRQIAAEARHLDPAEEEALTRPDAPASSPPWGRLTCSPRPGPADEG